MPTAIIRPPIRGADPDYTLQVHNALLQLDQKQQQLSAMLQSIQSAMATPTPAPAPAPAPAPIPAHVLSSFSMTGPPAPTFYWVVTHNLGTLDVLVGVRRIFAGPLSGEYLLPEMQLIDANTVAIIARSGMMPANQFVVIVHG
jgi:hypothetical protein